MKSLIILALLIAASASTRADDFRPGPSTTIEVQSGPTEPIVEPTPTPPKTDEQNLTKPRWAEVNAILDDIKIQNPPRSHRMIFKLGLIQLIPNTADAVLLGQDSNLISLGATYITNPWDNIGLEIRGIYGQNVFPNSASPNDASAFTYWVDLGPRYTFYLDNTKLDNNLAFKLLFHDNGSNFKLLADTTTNKYTFVTHYQSFSFSVERSLPVTRKLGVLASFDLQMITQATSPGSQHVLPTGYGFEIQGEIYYQIEIKKQPVRLGVSYWQQGNSNEFDDSAKQLVGKNSYFQLGRSIFANLTMMY